MSEQDARRTLFSEHATLGHLQAVLKKILRKPWKAEVSCLTGHLLVDHEDYVLKSKNCVSQLRAQCGDDAALSKSADSQNVPIVEAFLYDQGLQVKLAMADHPLEALVLRILGYQHQAWGSPHLTRPVRCNPMANLHWLLREATLPALNGLVSELAKWANNDVKQKTFQVLSGPIPVNTCDTSDFLPKSEDSLTYLSRCSQAFSHIIVALVSPPGVFFVASFVTTPPELLLKPNPLPICPSASQNSTPTQKSGLILGISHAHPLRPQTAPLMPPQTARPPHAHRPHDGPPKAASTAITEIRRTPASPQSPPAKAKKGPQKTLRQPPALPEAAEHPESPPAHHVRAQNSQATPRPPEPAQPPHAHRNPRGPTKKASQPQARRNAAANPPQDHATRRAPQNSKQTRHRPAGTRRNPRQLQASNPNHVRQSVLPFLAGLLSMFVIMHNWHQWNHFAHFTNYLHLVHSTPAHLDPITRAVQSSTGGLDDYNGNLEAFKLLRHFESVNYTFLRQYSTTTPFVVVHIPKTGGTTVTENIKREVLKKGCTYVDMMYNRGIEEMKKDASIFCKLVAKYMDLGVGPEEAVLREPISRLQSHYFFIKTNHPQILDGHCRGIENCNDFPTFIRLLASGGATMGMDNLQTRMLFGDDFWATATTDEPCRYNQDSCDKIPPRMATATTDEPCGYNQCSCDKSPPRMVTQEHLDGAIHNMIHKFAVVGITSRMDLFSRAMKAVFDLDPGLRTKEKSEGTVARAGTNMQHLNANPNATFSDFNYLDADTKALVSVLL
eukprot:gene9172-16304_t